MTCAGWEESEDMFRSDVFYMYRDCSDGRCTDV